jgi:hypothetical protein
VQQSFYDAIQGVHFTAPAISGIVETSLLRDLFNRALLSHILSVPPATVPPGFGRSSTSRLGRGSLD